MSNNQNGDDGLIECVSVGGVLIDLRDVSHNLRQQYHATAKRVGRGDRARQELQSIGEQILAEQAPNLATKAFATAHKQSRVRGDHAVLDKLLKRSR
jgi:hypothetical protein